MCKVGIQRNNGRFCWQIQVWSKIVEMKIWALFFSLNFQGQKQRSQSRTWHIIARRMSYFYLAVEK